VSQLTDPCGSLRIPADPYGSLQIPADPCGSLQIHTDPYRSLQNTNYTELQKKSSDRFRSTSNRDPVFMMHNLPAATPFRAKQRAPVCFKARMKVVVSMWSPEFLFSASD